MSLAGKCLGQPRTKDLRRQRSRFLRGEFPSWAKQYAGWTVSGHGSPSPLDLLALRAAHRGIQVRRADDKDHAAADPGLWEERWSPAQLLS
eukprot:9304325-Pyramimonas_sp.AAC.1